ncbi:MAG: DUF1349 domain-containing protein [Pseudomonadota bacterium]
MSNLKKSLAGATWHCEPPDWSWADDALALTTGEKTDFWQDTFYGFRRDDGHFLGCEVPGDFTASVTFDAAYEVLYDQAGLMMRRDAQNWLKSGIEYSDQVTNFSVVVTRDGRSDWSVIAVPRVSGPQTVRLTRKGTTVIAHFRGTDDNWHLMRLADFPSSSPVRVGPMACSPERAGLRVRFDALEVGPPIDNPLHDR